MISKLKHCTVVAGVLVLILMSAYLYLRHRLSGKGSNIKSYPAKAVLPPNDAEQLIVDPRSHTITIKRPGKTTVTHLPDRPTVVDIQKDGTVKVTASQYGLEHRLFLGAGYSDALRFGLGMDGLYWKALDLGAGIQANTHASDARAFIGLSYTVKDNLRMTVTYDHKQTVGAMLTLRI